MYFIVDLLLLLILLGVVITSIKFGFTRNFIFGILRTVIAIAGGVGACAGVFLLMNHFGWIDYLADAVVDLKKDKEKGSYNPLTELSENNFNFTPMLENILGEASHCFEMLPLVQDIGILKNIIYSGIWNMYNHKLGKGEKHNDQ